MNARDVLAGLKAAEWRRVHGGAMTTRRCPVCHGYAPGDAIEDECGHDEGCAIAAAIAYLETVVRDEDLQVARDAAYSLRVRVENYDGGDRPMSPPVALLRELYAAEDRLRELRAKK